jgi:hypothetical protein
MDPASQEFATKYGSKFSDFVTYDEAEKVYIARMVFQGFDETVRVISSKAEKFTDKAFLSLVMTYFDGSSVQTVYVPLLVDRGNGNCIQRGSNMYPCSMFSKATLLSVYQNGSRVRPGLKAGDVVEIWLPGYEAPTTPGASDVLAMHYADGLAEKYQNFVTRGDAIEMVVPIRVLLSCSTLSNEKPCYPVAK